MTLRNHIVWGGGALGPHPDICTETDVYQRNKSNKVAEIQVIFGVCDHFAQCARWYHDPIISSQYRSITDANSLEKISNYIPILPQITDQFKCALNILLRHTSEVTYYFWNWIELNWIEYFIRLSVQEIGYEFYESVNLFRVLRTVSHGELWDPLVCLP